MKSKLLSVLGVGVLAFSMSAMAAGQTFNGEIMDSNCAKAGNHDAMINSGKMKDAKSCTNGCVKGGASYVLYDSGKKMVYQLDDQTKSADFAGGKVKVTGTLDKTTNTIHVTDVRAS
jgi:type 1 fimbria pilin